MISARRLHAAHDELEVRVVVALLRADHQELALVVGAPVQSVRAVEHEDLERANAVVLHQLFDLADVNAVHRRQMKTVVHMKAPGGQLQHLREELRVRPALVQVVLSAAEIVEARSHAALRRGAALAHRVLGERRVDAGVHVRVDHAGESQAAFPVVGVVRIQVGCDAGELPILDAYVGFLGLPCTRTDDADVLDDDVVAVVFRHVL
jgi:hypothetical protein